MSNKYIEQLVKMAEETKEGMGTLGKMGVAAGLTGVGLAATDYLANKARENDPLNKIPSVDPFNIPKPKHDIAKKVVRKVIKKGR